MTRERAKRYFTEQLCKYHSVDFYWLEDRLVSRCVEVSVRMPVSPSAVFVGRYSYPFPPAQFLSDLDDVFAVMAHASGSQLHPALS